MKIRGALRRGSLPMIGLSELALIKNEIPWDGSSGLVRDQRDRGVRGFWA